MVNNHLLSAMYNETLSSSQASNLLQRLRAKATPLALSQNTLEDIVQQIFEFPPSIKITVKTSGPSLEGICFSSSLLCKEIAKYPEILQMDGTHDVEESRLTEMSWSWSECIWGLHPT